VFLILLAQRRDNSALAATAATVAIGTIFPADAAAAHAAVWIAMQAAVVAGFATLQFRAFASGEQ
jgi:hypothetical protein